MLQGGKYCKFRNDKTLDDVVQRLISLKYVEIRTVHPKETMDTGNLKNAFRVKFFLHFRVKFLLHLPIDFDDSVELPIIL